MRTRSRKPPCASIRRPPTRRFARCAIRNARIRRDDTHQATAPIRRDDGFARRGGERRASAAVARSARWPAAALIEGAKTRETAERRTAGEVNGVNSRRGAKSRAAGDARRFSQTNRIREDLQHLRSRVLLHSRNRYLHQDRRLGPRRVRDRRDRQLARPVHVGWRRPQQPHRLDRHALPRPYGPLARRAHPDRIRHRARLQPLRLHDDSTTIRRPACSTPSARSSRSPASPSARRSPTSTSSAARSATVAATAAISRSTGAGGTLVFAYSATLGNGFTATIAPRGRQPSVARRSGMPATTRPTRSSSAPMPGPIAAVSGRRRSSAALRSATTAAHSVPDIVGSLRVDQAWGSAQISAALHQIRGGYYGNNTTGAGANGTPFAAPEDTFGFAVDAGIIINLPWAKGDRFYVEGAYTEGAPAYAGWSGGVQGGYSLLQPLQRPQRGRGLGVRARSSATSRRPAARPATS